MERKYVIQVFDARTDEPFGYISGLHTESGTLLVPDFNEDVAYADRYSTKEEADNERDFWENMYSEYIFKVKAVKN